MNARKRQSFLYGAVILAGATMVVKLIGALFKIPLANLIGGVGMADFSIAYDIFRPLNALAIAGLPVAVSKMTSESVALGRYRDARRLLRLSTLLFLCTGILGAVIMCFGSRYFAELLGSPDSWLTIAALSPAVFFCCMMSAWRGYYQGLRNMYPTGVSQMVEALVKLVGGILLARLFMDYARESLMQPDGLVSRLYAQSSEEEVLILEFGAVGAVLGVTLSTLAGTLFLWLRHLCCGDGITRAEWQKSPRPEGRRKLMHRLFMIAVPVCLGSVATQLTTLIDLGSILNRLEHCMELSAQTLLAQYPGMIPEGYTHAQVAKFLYGSYSGIAVNIFNLVPSLTTTLGVSILPSVASAWAVRDRAALGRNMESVLRVTALIAIPAGLGISVMAAPITQLLYGSRPMEAAVAALLLRSLGIAVIFVALTTPINAVLQAIGRLTVPVKLMVLGGAIKLAVNFVLVGIPRINIQGAPVGTTLCYLFIVLISLHVLSRQTGIRFHYFGMFGKPLLAGIFCAAAARTFYTLFSHFSSSSLITLASIAIGGIFYLITILLTRAIFREDVLMLPGGEKIVKILEKHAMIG